MVGHGILDVGIVGGCFITVGHRGLRIDTLWWRFMDFIGCGLVLGIRLNASDRAEHGLYLEVCSASAVRHRLGVDVRILEDAIPRRGIGLWFVLEEDVFANSTGLVVHHDSVVCHSDGAYKTLVGSFH